MPLTANMNLYVTGNHTSALDLGTASLPFALTLEAPLTSGVAAGMADRVFTDTRTLGPSATENLDLAGSLLDAFGATITFVTIKGLFITAAAANVNDVQLSRPAANGWPLFLAVSDGLSIKPGYGFAWFGSGTGIAVVAGTGDLITITNSAAGTSITYNVVIIGTSA